jgi:hypothetical protein
MSIPIYHTRCRRPWLWPLGTCAVRRAPVSVASHPCRRHGRKETVPTSVTKPRPTHGIHQLEGRRRRDEAGRDRDVPSASGRYRRRSPSTRFVDVLGFGSGVSTHRHAGGETAFALAFRQPTRHSFDRLRDASLVQLWIHYVTKRSFSAAGYSSREKFSYGRQSKQGPMMALGSPATAARSAGSRMGHTDGSLQAARVQWIVRNGRQ